MQLLAHFLRLLRTLWFVPPRALLWRVWARLKRVYYTTPLHGLRRLMGWRESLPPGPLNWVGAMLVAGDAGWGRKLAAAGEWQFAGVRLALGTPPRTWRPREATALWVFHLHYFEWLADLRAAGERGLAQQLLRDWLQRFAHYDPVVWHAYPTSLRVVAWLTHGRWLLEDADEAMQEEFKRVLWAQYDYLWSNCEWDLGGNHLIKNVKALVFGALAWGETARLGRALQLLAQVLDEPARGGQVWADGGHFERSPLYQAQVLRDVLELRAALPPALPVVQQELTKLARRMGTALAVWQHPDGELALFNDSATLEAKYVRELLRLSGADDAPAWLPQTQVARLSRGRIVVLANSGKVGPDENPGHAHADTLSLEWSLGTQRVVVNGGTFGYQHAWRQALRGTAAHSTVQVGHFDSAEVWGNFRVGRRPRRVSGSVTELSDGAVEWVGQHDGYAWLGVQHQRRVHVAKDGKTLLGMDVLTKLRGSAWPRVEALFHLHPDVRVELVSEQEVRLTLPLGEVVQVRLTQGRVQVKPSRYAPQFGTMLPTQQLVLRGVPRGDECRLEWQFCVK